MDNEIPVPENVFANTEWEYFSDSDGGAGNIYQKKLYFTDNAFTFTFRQDRLDINDTVIGSYKLFYVSRPNPHGDTLDPILDPKIEFISDEPQLNGVSNAWYQPIPIGSTWMFILHGHNVNHLHLLYCTFTRIK
jgi:hypothetical protein